MRIPVKFVNGHWELLYGGGVPVKEGTFGELLVEPSAITDKNLRGAITKKRRVKILGVDCPLCVAIKPGKALDATACRFLHDASTIKHTHTAKISVDSRFVRIHLGPPTASQQRRGEGSGGVWLLLEGITPRGLESSTVTLPAIPGLTEHAADSLNQAYTLLSEVLEPWRVSHTGNIYEHVLYQRPNGVWHPLKDLRDRELARAEQHVIETLWEAVLAQMEPL